MSDAEVIVSDAKVIVSDAKAIVSDVKVRAVKITALPKYFLMATIYKRLHGFWREIIGPKELCPRANYPSSGS